MQDIATILARLTSLEVRVPLLEQENAALRAENTALKKRVAELEERLGLNSKNSSKPPSSDVSKNGSIVQPSQPPAPKGAQKGHTGARRRWFSPEEVTRIHAVYPPTCLHCTASLADLPALGTPEKRQVVDLPDLRPDVTEYHLHRVACPCCEKVTQAEPPPEALTDTGPRITAWMAVLSVKYRLSRECVAELCESLLQIPMSKGTVQAACEEVSEALAAPVAEMTRQLPQQPVVHLDETGWYQGGKRIWLWVAVAPALVVFSIHPSRGQKQLQTWFPNGYQGVVHSDRWMAYDAVFRDTPRQVCWAHLLRDLQRIVEFGEAGQEPTRLLQPALYALFHQWHRFREGAMDRAALLTQTQGFREQLWKWSEAGAAQTADAKWRALSEWVRHCPGAIFRFLEEAGVEPTNNAGEQEIRTGVLYRKMSQGTKSEAGSRFVERILSVMGTCRRQGTFVVGYVTEALNAWRAGLAWPSLLPQLEVPG
jgi:transposase